MGKIDEIGRLSRLAGEFTVLKGAFFLADYDMFDNAAASPVGTQRWAGEVYLGAAENSDADINTTTPGKAYVIADPDGTPAFTAYWLRSHPNRGPFFTVQAECVWTWGPDVPQASDVAGGLMISRGWVYDAGNYIFFGRRRNNTPTNDLIIVGALNGTGFGPIIAAIADDALVLAIERHGNTFTFYYSRNLTPPYQWVFVDVVEDPNNYLTSQVSLSLAAESGGTTDDQWVQVDYDNFQYYTTFGAIEGALGPFLAAAMRPRVELVETWQDPAGIDPAVWGTVLAATGAVGRDMTEAPYFKVVLTGPANADTARLHTNEQWFCAPNLYGPTLIAQRLTMEWEAKFDTVASINNDHFIMGLVSSLVSTRAAPDVIGFILAGDVLGTLTDRGGAEMPLGAGAPTITDWHKYRIEVSFATVEFFVDDALVMRHSTVASPTLPDVAMYPTFYLPQEAGANGGELHVAWVRLWVEDIAR